MHCWRHKTPIIYRASSQWFAGMDLTPREGGPTLRETALRSVEATVFYPAWGKARLHGMIANRPDWTLSRQRQWGVPMAFFVHRETGALHPRTAEPLLAVASRIEAGGIVAWPRLAPAGLPLVLLKGSAFLAAGLAAGKGPQVGDLDLLVPRARIDRAGPVLLAAGWARLAH